MTGSVPHRSVTPIINFLRSVMRGKPQQHNALRYADRLAARTQPLPDLPGGPYAKTTQIYYYPRDARREVQPPIVVLTADQLGPGKEKKEIKHLTPGNVYQPD